MVSFFRLFSSPKVELILNCCDFEAHIILNIMVWNAMCILDHKRWWCARALLLLFFFKMCSKARCKSDIFIKSLLSVIKVKDKWSKLMSLLSIVCHKIQFSPICTIHLKMCHKCGIFLRVKRPPTSTWYHSAIWRFFTVQYLSNDNKEPQCLKIT